MNQNMGLQVKQSQGRTSPLKSASTVHERTSLLLIPHFSLCSLEYLMKPNFPQIQPPNQSARPKTHLCVWHLQALPTVVCRAPRNPHICSDFRYLANTPNPFHVSRLGPASVRVSSSARRPRHQSRYAQLLSNPNSIQHPTQPLLS